MSEMLTDEFMKAGYLPSRLPVSCLTMAPKYDKPHITLGSLREPLTEINKDPRTLEAVTNSTSKKTSSVSSDNGALDMYLSDLQRYAKISIGNLLNAAGSDKHFRTSCLNVP